MHERVGDWLRAAFGEQVREAPDERAYYVARGRIGARVEVTDVGDGDQVIEVYSWIAHQLPVSPAIGLWLAQRNAELRFGTLSVDGEDAIILGHAMFADATNQVVLARLVRIVSETADALDAELRSQV